MVYSFMLGIFVCLSGIYKVTMIFCKKFFQEFQTALIQIRPDIFGLIRVQKCINNCQETTQFVLSRQRFNTFTDYIKSTLVRCLIFG